MVSAASPSRSITNSGTGCLRPPKNFASFLKKINPSSSSNASRLAREPYLYLTTRGRKSGLPREIEIWFTERDGRFYVIAEYATSNWIQNLRTHPEVQVRAAGKHF